jgi:hypothetical protein
VKVGEGATVAGATGGGVGMTVGARVGSGVGVTVKVGAGEESWVRNCLLVRVGVAGEVRVSPVVGRPAGRSVGPGGEVDTQLARATAPSSHMPTTAWA